MAQESKEEQIVSNYENKRYPQLIYPKGHGGGF